jgi:uncharacterized membrane protein YjjP (DUF1212 family)
MLTMHNAHHLLVNNTLVMAWFHFVFVLTFFGGIAAGKLTYQVETNANPKVFAKFRVDIFNEIMNATMDLLKVLEGKSW